MITTKAGQWLLDRSHWDSGMRGFFVRINATAGPEDMERHVLAIEAEARLQVPTEILHFEENATPERVEEVRAYFSRVEQRAVAAALARVRERVEGLADHEVCRADVLAIVDEEAER